MIRPIILALIIRVFPAIAVFHISGCCEGKAGKEAGGEAGESAFLPALPEGEEVTLRLEGEQGPASLTVRLREGTSPPPSWRPDWLGLKGPFVPTGRKDEYSAPVAVDLPTVRRWDNPPPSGGQFFWEDRFARPQKCTVVRSPEKPAFPMELRYGLKQRPRQVPLSFNIEPEKSLFVTAVDVVNDSSRTWEPSTGAGDRNGVWTFNHMVSSVANEKVTGIKPGDLVQQWMESFCKDQKPDGPNGGVAPARNAQLINTALTAWPKLPGTSTMDTSQAPFRLLAIVNRLDLRFPGAYGAGDTRRAELRFIFCYVEQPGQPEPGMYRDFLAIFEFGIPLATFKEVRDYALRWANLSRPDLTPEAMRAELAGITEDYVAAGKGGTRPNGSNLSHLRTEDLYFALPSQMWDLREFIVDGTSHGFKTNPLDQTPDFSWAQSVNCMETMRGWIETNADPIINGRYVLPESLKVEGKPAITKRLRGATALDGYQNWFQYPTTVPCADAPRLAFILNTCNGCHSECPRTPDTPQPWTFTYTRHVYGRPAATASTLSGFLIKDELPRRLDILRRIVESDPLLPIDEFFQRQVMQVH